MVEQEKIRNLPQSSGVYIMKGASGEALYVGKAVSLRKRVSSYFRAKAALTSRIASMIELVRDVDYIPTSTEAEALIYENGLIKHLEPKYNVALKDGKSYPMLKLTANERFPRLFITRQKKDDGAIYYGPYSNAKLLRQAVIFLRQIFPLRSCGKMGKRVCLDYHIKQCLGPCEGRVDDRIYGEIVSELKLFLQGRRRELVDTIASRMREAAKAENFELASKYKTRLETLSTVRGGAVAYTPSGELDELKNILVLSKPPETIEAFDVSNIMAEAAVGSMIYFYKGLPKKSEYRKFRIKTVSGVDDYAMMREIVRRRYSRILKENGKLPDLILIDGGRGHLSAACDELERLGLSRLPVLSIAKEFEKLYMKGRKDPIILPPESKALHLLQRIRDEAHRFAISYHKRLLSKRYK